MDFELMQWYNNTVYFQMELLQAEIKMQGMIAENKQREIEGKSMAYTEKAFTDLVDEYRIHHNAFPYYGDNI